MATTSLCAPTDSGCPMTSRFVVGFRGQVGARPVWQGHEMPAAPCPDEAEERERHEAKRLLKYPPVQFTGVQARAIGQGFANACRKSGFTVWACAILPEHTHLVIARHTYKVEYIVNLLKGEATKELRRESLDPWQRLLRTANGRSRRGQIDAGKCFWIPKRPLRTRSTTSTRILKKKENRRRNGRSSAPSADCHGWAYNLPLTMFDRDSTGSASPAW